MDIFHNNFIFKHGAQQNLHIARHKKKKKKNLPVTEIDENIHIFSTSNDENYIIKMCFASEMEVA